MEEGDTLLNRSFGTTRSICEDNTIAVPGKSPDDESGGNTNEMEELGPCDS